MKNQKSLGCWMPFTSVQLIELLAIAGFDFVQLDGEHGAFLVTGAGIDNAIGVNRRGNDVVR